jgi:TonB family protein
MLGIGGLWKSSMAEMAIRTAHLMARVAAAAGVLTLAIFATTCAWAQEQASSPPERAAQVVADPVPVRPIRVSGSATQATLLSQVAPVYPPIAKTAHISGTVLLHCLIGKDGSVETLEYVSGPPLLMKAALDAVRQWKYKPMSLNGQPVRVDTTVSVVFMLDAAPAAAASQQSKSDPTEWYKARGYVNDFAGMIDSPVQAQLEQVCKDLDQKTHTRMAIVTVESLEGLSAKDFAVQLANRWGVGHKDTNRGVLLLLSDTDRQYRISVSRALEPLISDEEADRLGKEMLPILHQGDYGGALLHLAKAIRDELQQKIK